MAKGAAGKTESMKVRKQRMLDALEMSLGIITTACKAAKVSRMTHYIWMEADEKYKKAVEDIEEQALDFGESALLKRIKSGSDTAIIFYLKTKGKKRGYVERQELTGKDGEPLNKGYDRMTDEELQQKAKELEDKLK